MSSIRNLRVRCDHCTGSGHVRLSLHLADTIEAIVALERDRGAGWCAPDLHRVIPERYRPPRVTAVNNRIAVLRELGFVREIGKRGKAFRYELVREALHANPGWRT